MSVLFLTLRGLTDYAATEHFPDDNWRETALFFLNCGKDQLTAHPELEGVVRRAEESHRVAWRTGNASDNQNLLSELLSSHQLEELNPNLPPIDEPSFLKIAVERVNNKHVRRVEVIV